MGRRTNIGTTLQNDYTTFSRQQFDVLIERNSSFTDMFISVAQDIFIYNHGMINLQEYPLSKLVIGRNGYDNYMVDYCIKKDIKLIDVSLSSNRWSLISNIAVVYHQTDGDGNWAGNRYSPDHSWNTNLVGKQLVYTSTSFAPYQLLHYKNGRYNLHKNNLVDNDYSEEEIQYIKSNIPKNASSGYEFTDWYLDCVFFGRGSFKPFLEGMCKRFVAVLYDNYFW